VKYFDVDAEENWLMKESDKAIRLKPERFGEPEKEHIERPPAIYDNKTPYGIAGTE
jgi:hypothetical protein